MRNFIVGLTASAALGVPAIAQVPPSGPSNSPVETAITSPPAKPLTTCELLSRDWRNVEIELAKSNIEDIGDNSAPRATMRAIKDTNSIQIAAITLMLMRDHKCSVPKRAPSHVTYMIPAMECRTEQLKGNYKAPQCETSTWKPLR